MSRSQCRGQQHAVPPSCRDKTGAPVCPHLAHSFPLPGKLLLGHGTNYGFSTPNPSELLGLFPDFELSWLQSGRWYCRCSDLGMPYLQDLQKWSEVVPAVAAIMAETNRPTLILPERARS